MRKQRVLEVNYSAKKTPLQMLSGSSIHPCVQINTSLGTNKLQQLKYNQTKVYFKIFIPQNAWK